VGDISHKFINPPPIHLFVNVGQKGEVIRKFITQVREKEFPYERRPPRKTDWSSYDRAQVNEIADFVEMTRLVVDAAAKRLEGRRSVSKRGRGHPPVPAADILKVIMLQSYLGVSNRVAEGLLRLLWANLGLTKPFTYKTIERGYDRREVNSLMNEVLALTNAPVQELEKVFSIDGSGSPTRVRQNYAESRAKQKSGISTDGGSDAFPKAPHDFVYHTFMVGTAFKLISSWRSTARHDIGELFFYEQLVRETKALHPGMEMAVGDGLYAVRPCVALLDELGVTARFLPRRNVTLKRKGVDGWIHMLMPMLRDPQSWLRDYFQREASESTNSVIARENPGPLRKILNGRRCGEDKLRGVCYNVRRVCYLAHMAGLAVKPLLRGRAG
jgi:transposase